MPSPPLLTWSFLSCNLMARNTRMKMPTPKRVVSTVMGWWVEIGGDKGLVPPLPIVVARSHHRQELLLQRVIHEAAPPPSPTTNPFHLIPSPSDVNANDISCYHHRAMSNPRSSSLTIGGGRDQGLLQDGRRGGMGLRRRRRCCGGCAIH
jgi:hypothetical protein